MTLFRSIFVVLSVAALGCGVGSTSELTSTEPSEQGESELRTRRCDYTQLFVQLGFVQDLAAALDTGPYTAHVPGVVSGHLSYGGDMVSVHIGVKTSAARIWDTNPGGDFSATIGGFVEGGRYDLQGLQMASKLFRALKKGTTSTVTEHGLVTVTKRSPGGRVTCEATSKVGTSAHISAQCTFSKLLSSTPLSYEQQLNDFCPGIGL
jgi:hypothetical protein